MQNRLVSAKQWLASTANKLFSSSNEDLNSNSQSQSKLTLTLKEDQEQIQKQVKRGRGRPRKGSNDPKVPRFVPNRREKDLGKTRSSVLKAKKLKINELPPNDGQVRYLLTINSLPKNLQILAKSLHPVTKNKYEEHQLVCKILQEEQRTKPHEIFIPTFQKLSRNRTKKDIETGLKQKEFISDEECLQRHRPLELAERRERKREEELIRYEIYIRKLSREYPELLNRKYSITTDRSASSLSSLTSIDH